MPKLRVFKVTLERTQQCDVYVIATSKEDIDRTIRDGATLPGENLISRDDVDFSGNSPRDMSFSVVNATEVIARTPDIDDEYQGWTTVGAWEALEALSERSDDVNEPTTQETVVFDVLNGDLPLAAFFKNRKHFDIA